MAEHAYYVYLLTTQRDTVLYVGMSNDVLRRTYQHKTHVVPGFTQRYNVDKLVYYETHATAYGAITREKQLKAGSRAKKVALIEAMNPEWRDLYDDLIGNGP